MVNEVQRSLVVLEGLMGVRMYNTIITYDIIYLLDAVDGAELGTHGAQA